MTQSVIPSNLWAPTNGPSLVSLDRMARAFPTPITPMGEAWFMGGERQLYPELLGDLEALPDEFITHVIEEIASGSSCFGPLAEWIEWYGYLLPRLILREWKPTYNQPAELLVTAFMVQHPTSEGSMPYPEYRDDALGTLGRYIMSERFWPNGELDALNCLSKWTGPNGISGWSDAGNLLSASLFFCIKYLSHSDAEAWFRSVTAISDKYWQAQIMTWLVGAHPVLIGEIRQPSELPDAGFGVQWNWSHTLNGDYSGELEPPDPIVFLPAENCEAVLRVARGIDAEGFLEKVWTAPEMNAVVAEAAGMPERFIELYRADRAAG